MGVCMFECVCVCVRAVWLHQEWDLGALFLCFHKHPVRLNSPTHRSLRSTT